jgi:hypothetical protein
MAIDLFSPGNNSIDVYNSSGNGTTGLDLRAELKTILYTDNQGAHVLFRRAKLENGYPKKCICTLNNRSNEPSKDIPCDKCGGMGYYYTDVLTRSYINHSQAYSIYKKNKPEGDYQTEYKTAYFEWDFLLNSIDDGFNIPTRFDRIIELDRDLQGKIMSPSKPREIYEILSVDPYRLDNTGRIEYYRCRIISVIDKSFLV